MLKMKPLPDLPRRTVDELVALFRYEANGHDAICLLGHFLRSSCKKAKDSDKTHPHVLVHLLTCSLEVVDLQEQPMFQRLLERLTTQPGPE
jgi:hypothetical protein